MSKQENSVTVENFGLTVDSSHPNMTSGAAERKVTRGVYNKHAKQYAALVAKFEASKTVEDATKVQSDVKKCASWFVGVGVKANRGPARQRKADKAAKDAKLSATANSANASLRERNERNDLAMARLGSANRDTKFGKKVVTDCSINSLLHEDVSNFIRDNAPELLTGEYRLKISGMARTATGIFTVVWRDVDSIAPDGVTVKRSKLWSVFIGDGKGNMIAYDIDTDRPTVNSTLIAAIRPLIAAQYKLAPDDGDVLPILIKKTIQSIFG